MVKLEKKNKSGGNYGICALNPYSRVYRHAVRRTTQKCIYLPFLGLVDNPYKVAKLWGLYRLSNKILSGLRP